MRLDYIAKKNIPKIVFVYKNYVVSNKNNRYMQTVPDENYWWRQTLTLYYIWVHTLESPL